MYTIFFVLIFAINLTNGDYFLNRVNHMEFYMNRTRPSKAFSSFSTNYFNQNVLQRPGKQKVQCGTRTVDFNPRRTAKIVGGMETPYGAFPWQQMNGYGRKYQRKPAEEQWIMHVFIIRGEICCEFEQMNGYGRKYQRKPAEEQWIMHVFIIRGEICCEFEVEIQMLDQDRLSFEHQCGGAVVAERLVLSAAHCFDKQPLQIEHIRLVMGEHRLNFPDKHEHRFLAEKVVPHPEFRKNGPHSNDIALILVARSGTGVQFNSHVRPICLPDAGADSEGRWCAVSGWGFQTESTESFAPVLRAAAVPVLDLATCRKDQILGGRQQAILDSMICAGILSGGVDACKGDSGGPLACMKAGRWQLHGLVSWGAGCGRRARPGVYTRVAAYVDWLASAAGAMGQRIGY